MSEPKAAEMTVGWFGSTPPNTDISYPSDPLERAISDLERAAGQTHRAVGLALARSLESVGQEVANYIQRTEGPDGLLRYVEDHRPDLAYRVTKMRAQQTELVRQIDQLRTTASEPPAPSSPASLRASIQRLLEQMRSQRQRGMELGFLAYLADLGAGE